MNWIGKIEANNETYRDNQENETENEEEIEGKKRKWVVVCSV